MTRLFRNDGSFVYSERVVHSSTLVHKSRGCYGWHGEMYSPRFFQYNLHWPENVNPSWYVVQFVIGEPIYKGYPKHIEYDTMVIIIRLLTEMEVEYLEYTMLKKDDRDGLYNFVSFKVPYPEPDFQTVRKPVLKIQQRRLAKFNLKKRIRILRQHGLRSRQEAIALAKSQKQLLKLLDLRLREQEIFIEKQKQRIEMVDAVNKYETYLLKRQAYQYELDKYHVDFNQRVSERNTVRSELEKVGVMFDC